jgi:AcrR family transcriptional regulator
MSTDPSQHDAVDPRVRRSRAAVLEAACELLMEVGFGGVTMEGVSARSGVAKTTMYRQWPDSNHLLLDVFSLVSAETVTPTTDDLEHDLVECLRQLVSTLTNPESSGMVAALIEASERDEEFRRISRPSIDARRKPVVTRLRVAVRSGQLPPDTDVELVCGLLVGPLFYRRLLSRQSLTDKTLLPRLVHMVIAGAKSTD